jgi:hypothetical protein
VERDHTRILPREVDVVEAAHRIAIVVGEAERASLRVWSAATNVKCPLASPQRVP